MDKDIDVVILDLIKRLSNEYPTLTFEVEKKMFLSDIIAALSTQYPGYAKYFSPVRQKSCIKPDGGFLFCTNKKGERRLILVSEIKRQGTNDKRKIEGLGKQALGNAIERLGKNIIGIRTIFKHQGTLPFVCFGSGYDFNSESSILDRVVTINEFFPLNTVFVEKNFLPFEPASLFFREKDWTQKEMSDVLYRVAKRSIESKFI